MTKHGLLVCSFTLKRKYSSGEADDYILLNQKYTCESGEYDDFFSLFEGFADYYSELKNDDDLSKDFMIDKHTLLKCDKGAYTLFSGIITSGSYGVESKITDIDSKEVVYNRRVTDADNKDFTFSIYIPKGDSENAVIKGLLMFEMIGVYGVKTITVDYMKKYFSEEYKLTLETRNVSIRAYVDNLFTNHTINKITMVTNRVSGDPADNMFVSTGREEKSFIKPRLTVEGKKRLLDAFIKPNPLDVIEVDNQEVKDISMNFYCNGRSVTLRQSNVDKFSMIEDMPENVGKGGKDAKIGFMEEVAGRYAESTVFILQ